MIDSTSLRGRRYYSSAVRRVRSFHSMGSTGHANCSYSPSSSQEKFLELSYLRLVSPSGVSVFDGSFTWKFSIAVRIRKKLTD